MDRSKGSQRSEHSMSKVRKVKEEQEMMKCIKWDATELNPYKGKSEERESWGSWQGPDPDGYSEPC